MYCYLISIMFLCCCEMGQIDGSNVIKWFLKMMHPCIKVMTGT